ncbi:hypothetical protein M2341_002847 [Sphingobium sp. B7D2B]|uniref:nuclear transport factor 2 family protein n=1 Tax=unclassified Sphingobium TaxID=2611147 RepID=UPI00222428D9|nr:MULTISPECIES: nuclear transport factor 2 family protein [unclassified Sphingobium]MCW2349448.1 hypothetical protein [Sphingobium sp. B12D2B]MCW2367400.1 hypothetical protein [Sphingobium sp. B7D2B]MCW2411039.1 hypothetical protein [Sphingobium sp. B8D3D]MCW2416669.1 hypothetical protein [Sphingobium sp. B8D3A]
MTTRTTLTGVALSALMLVAQPAPLLAQHAGHGDQADHARILQEVQDRTQIEKLMWDYVRAADSLNADAYAAQFTPDGAFNDVKGSEALRKMITAMKTSQEERRAKGEHIGAMHHMMSNQTITFIDRDHAQVNYYWQTVFADRALNPPPRLAAAGRGRDDVVRVNGKWLIQLRNVAVKD